MGATSNSNVFVRAPQFKTNILSPINQAKLLFSVVLFFTLFYFFFFFFEAHLGKVILGFRITGMNTAPALCFMVLSKGLKGLLPRFC